MSTPTIDVTSDDQMRECRDSGCPNMNPHLKDMTSDVLYHLALSTHSDLKEMFGDVKVIQRNGDSKRDPLERPFHYLCSLFAWEEPRVEWRSLPTSS
jgi:hypothetical protein